MGAKITKREILDSAWRWRTERLDKLKSKEKHFQELRDKIQRGEHRHRGDLFRGSLLVSVGRKILRLEIEKLRNELSYGLVEVERERLLANIIWYREVQRTLGEVVINDEVTSTHVNQILKLKNGRKWTFKRRVR